MSANLKQFLAAWLEWVEKGAPDEEPFCRRRGLCANFEEWLCARNECEEKIEEENDQLLELFRADGFEPIYPFGGCEEFYAERDDDTMHLNEARLAWVRSKVAQFEAA